MTSSRARDKEKNNRIKSIFDSKDFKNYKLFHILVGSFPYQKTYQRIVIPAMYMTLSLTLLGAQVRMEKKKLKCKFAFIGVL